MGSSENTLVTCANCGAQFDGEAAHCPYCGALNPGGAEKKYMAELEEIKESTDDLDDDVQHDLEDNLKRNSLSIVRVMAIVVFVIFALYFIVRHHYL